MPRYHIASYAVVAKASASSLFGELSRRINEPVVLYVDRNDKEKLYFTIAITSKHWNFSKEYSSEIYKNSGVIFLEELKFDSHSVVLAVKERCDFLQLIDYYNIRIVKPYIMFHGLRKFCIYGDQSNIEKYIDNLLSYYGLKNVAFTAKPLPSCIKDMVHEITKSYALLTLTKRELEVLLKAYETGYILAPRQGGGLKKLSQLLGLSKPSIHITLRKAINKIVKEIIV